MIDEIQKKIEKLKETKVEKLKKGVEGNGGKREGSGRKPKEEKLIERGIKAYVDAHVNESVRINITDPKTGQQRQIDKPRVVIVLETLFTIGVKDKSTDALGKWLDRALGKPVQPIVGDEEKPIMIKIDF